ncbi:NUDIX domain-containing protein [Tranquillimonas alkanivorans]|nr:NUDIX domain-containing protein [Tranquillimonas alkanivorans]
MTSPRLAVRAVIVHLGRLLVVNAYPDGQSDLWCVPGGGAERHASLPDNLRREIFEETGLEIEVGAPVMINEFHAPDTGFHQVDVYFRCTVADGTLPESWQDPEGIVAHRRWASEDELTRLRYKPDSLPRLAWGAPGEILYDPLELLVR